MSSSAENRHAQLADEHEASDRLLLTIGRGWAIYIGPIEDGRPHRHHAAQLAWSKQGILLLEGVWGGLKSPGHFLPAGVPHRIVATGPVRMVFLDQTMHSVCPTGRRPSATMAPSPVPADMLEYELDRWLRGAMPSETANVSQPATEASRWASVLQWLETSLEGPVHVAHAADAVGLSSSRFMHWFAEASGLSFRAYVRWLRLQRAVRTLSDGCTLTEAAHLAGFADSAHLTRTFVSTFGVRPAPLRGARIVCTAQSRPPFTLHGLEFVDTIRNRRRQMKTQQRGNA